MAEIDRWEEGLQAQLCRDSVCETVDECMLNGCLKMKLWDPIKNCPNKANHTPCPESYIQWHAWARRMGKTHKQVKCLGCNRLTIWVPKQQRAKT